MLEFFKRIGKTEIGGSIVSRIAAEDEQQVDFACAHVGNQIAQRFGLVDWISVDRVGIEDRLPTLPSAVIDSVSESVNRRRLVLARR